ncbi:MAG: intradiol ring-cleavage dioxygenase [Pseudomonadota bacterium]|nr:intradiol ring-cleavage dioxygenase [Pseudomonadota bacterium]
MTHSDRWSRRSVIAALLVGPAACYARPSGGTQASQARELRPIAGCEGCEAAWERDPSALSSRIKLAAAEERGEPMLLTGTVFRADGKTPAPDIVLYIHHTNASGRYADGTQESEWSRRHGRLRGWLKTGSAGRYEVLTIKPGRYPDRTDPAHVHMTVLDGDKDPYWVEDVVFDGEPGVDAAYRAERTNRGGSGIVRVQKDGAGRWIAQRDIILM